MNTENDATTTRASTKKQWQKGNRSAKRFKCGKLPSAKYIDMVQYIDGGGNGILHYRMFQMC